MQWTDWSADQSIVDTQLAVNEILLQTRVAEHKRSKPRQQITVDVVFVFVFMLNWNQITVKTTVFRDIVRSSAFDTRK